MILTATKDLQRVNKHFNWFHDGFIKKATVISGTKFTTGVPWEPKKPYPNNEEELLDTGRRDSHRVGIRLSVCHYNYNWPRQSNRTQIDIWALSIREYEERLAAFAGMRIFDMRFIAGQATVICQLTWHDQYYTSLTHENGIKTPLFSASKVRLVEKSPMQRATVDESDSM